MEDDNKSTKRFDDAVVRFANSMSPLVVAKIAEEKRDNPTSPKSASHFLMLSISALIARFITTDGTISVAEATAFDAFRTGNKLAPLVQAMGGLQGGTLYDGIYKMGTINFSLASLQEVMPFLATYVGEPGIVEWVTSTKELASAICELDGRTPEEDRRLEEFYADLDKAVASNSSGGQTAPSV